jgi:hypothetical protein
VRAAPVFSAAVSVNASALAPLVGVTVSQAASDAADHDTTFVVTVTDVVSPAAGGAQADADSVSVEAGTVAVMV